MQAIYNTKTSIITRMIDTSEQNIGKYLNENEDYKQIPFSNDLSKGQDISKFTDEGRLRPNSELLAENLITLQEDQILDGEVIRDLTEDELKEKYPLRYSVPEQTDLEQSSPEKAALDLLAKQEFRAENLKEQYLETDLNDNKDPILDNEVIRDLTEDESKVTPPQIYSVPEQIVPEQIVPEQIVPEQIVPAQISPEKEDLDLLAKQEFRAENLKEQYIEADLNDNKDPILDNEVIRDLTEDESKATPPQIYSVPEQIVPVQISPEKAALDLLAKKEFRAENLKEQYLEADLNDNKDPILDNEVIRDLTEDESKVTPPQIYSVPEQIVPAQISPITTILELLAEKESKAKNLKEQYLEADLDDNEDLKSSLKIQIQELRREISILKG